LSISGFFWQATIHSPASIPIGNKADVTRDIIFRHCTVSLTELYFPLIEAIDKVQIARSATARTDRQLARRGASVPEAKAAVFSFRTPTHSIPLRARTESVMPLRESLATPQIRSTPAAA
jgi:hypothetical protein